MKLMWTLFLTWSLFYAADALQCTTCNDFTDFQCTNTTSRECAANQLCLSATLSASVTGFGSLAALNVVTKLCVPAATCAVLGNAAFTTNLGFAVGAASSLCCNTDDCNSATLSVSTQQGNNDLTCFTCDSLTDANCTTTVQCVGSQDRCVNGSVRTTDSTINIFGCASASLCTAISILTTIPTISNLANFIDGPTCCEGDRCNSVATATATPNATATATASILSLSILPLLMAPLTFTLTF